MAPVFDVVHFFCCHLPHLIPIHPTQFQYTDVMACYFHTGATVCLCSAVIYFIHIVTSIHKLSPEEWGPSLNSLHRRVRVPFVTYCEDLEAHLNTLLWETCILKRNGKGVVFVDFGPGTK